MTLEEIGDTIRRSISDAALAEELVRDPRFRKALQRDRDLALARFGRDRSAGTPSRPGTDAAGRGAPRARSPLRGLARP